MMTMAGHLDRRVQFRRRSVVNDTLSHTEVWADLGCQVWASKADVSDGERMRAAQAQATITTRFRVRWSSFTVTITPKDRLVCAGVEYDITGIKEVGARHEFLEITAATRADR